MQDLRITLVQADQVWEDKEANFALYESMLLNCSASDLIILPEMFHTSFSMHPEKLAEIMEDSEGISFLKEISKKHSCAVYTSLIIKEKKEFYNRGVFVYPNGKIITYDKRKRFALAGEDLVFSAGNKEVIVEYLGWKINLQICYDLRFPEIVRNSIQNDGKPKYDVLLYVANWPTHRKHHWNTLLCARAIENQCYVIGVNRVGIDGKGLNYSGNSVVYNLLGEAIITSKENESSCTNGSLNFNELQEVRYKLPFLKDAD